MEASTKLEDIFSLETVVSFGDGATKLDVLNGLVRSVAQTHGIDLPTERRIAQALTERENSGSTGLEMGLALPHLRCRDVDRFLGAIGVASSGIDFDSLDGSPAYLIVFLLSPFDERARHAEFLGRLAMLPANRSLQYWLQLPRSSQELLDLVIR